MPRLKKQIKAIANRLKAHGSRYWSWDGLYFIPAVFFISLGICLLVAPNLVIGLLAGFSIFLGIVSAIFAWKFLRLRRKFDKLLQALNGKVLIHSVRLEDDLSEEDLVNLDEESFDGKKFIFH